MDALTLMLGIVKFFVYASLAIGVALTFIVLIVSIKIMKEKRRKEERGAFIFGVIAFIVSVGVLLYIIATVLQPATKDNTIIPNTNQFVIDSNVIKYEM